MVENNELSRRSFLKRSGALTLGSVAAGSALLTGCDNPNNHLILVTPSLPYLLGILLIVFVIDFTLRALLLKKALKSLS